MPISGFDPRRQEHYDHWAFVPTPLEDMPILSPETHARVSQAMLMLGRLDQATAQIPNPGLLRRPSLTREAHSTSALEGTYAPFTDVLEAEVADVQAPVSPQLREFLNYIRVSEYAFEWIRERPITTSLLCDLQQRLVRGTRGETRDTGRLRDVQVVIGPEGAAVTEARFVPPPPGVVLEEGMYQWERWINDPNPADVVIRAALSHYQFETLHPFSDGNGRLGRLTVILQLVHGQALREPLIAISPWLELRRREYQDHLYNVSLTGQFESWVAFFAEAIRASAEETCAQVDALLSVQTRFRELCRARRIRGVAAQLAEDVIGYSIIRVAWVADRYNVSYQAANTAVRRLVELDILKERTGRSYDRIFSAPEVLRILNR